MRFGISIPGSDDSDDSQEEIRSRVHAEFVTEPLGREHYPDLEKALCYQFKDRASLERAVTHRSVQARATRSSSESGKPGESGRNDYERLEFLGDAVLDLAVAQLLLEFYPDAREGELSKMRAAIVNTASLAEIARSLNLGPYLRLSRGELASGGADRSSILADVFEALVGAIFKEAGYETVFECVKQLLLDKLKNVTPTDPKTELQEALHAAGSSSPVYLLECVQGPEHAPTFVSVVQVDGQVVGRGSGATKKASQQAAAAEALSRLQAGDHIDQKFFINPVEPPSEGTSE